MDPLIFYFIGWLILSIGIYIYSVYGNDHKESKKLWAWRSFWAGIVSWFGILFIIASAMVFAIVAINDWVEEKLK